MQDLIKNQWLNFLISGIMVFFTIGFLFTPHLPYSDLPLFRSINEYAVHGMLVLLVLGLVFFIMNRSKLMFTALACCSSLCIFLKNASNTNLILPKDAYAPKLTIAHYNLSYIEGGYTELVSSIKDLNPDLISLQEFTPNWKAFAEENLSEKYVFSEEMVRIDPFGKAIYSKLPIMLQDTFHALKNPLIDCTIDMEGDPIRIISTYMMPPLYNKKYDNVADQLSVISDKINESKTPIINLGDFNMVYWSTEIRDYRNNCKLLNSRRGFTPNGFQLPYDHMFYSEALECTRFEEILDSKSKHIGIYGCFQFKMDANQENMHTEIGYMPHQPPIK